jgi:broad specificity phosphatase PhoE
MRIYFARHGESQANLSHTISNRGLPHRLTKKGREQAEALANQLNGVHITHIFTSPVPRAVETSAIVAQRLELTYTVVDALREYDCGILEGRSDEAAWQKWQELHDLWVFQNKWDRRIDGSESFLEVQQRFIPFIQGLVSQFASTTAQILCISHGGIYSVMLPLVVKNLDQALITKYGFGYTSYVVVECLPEGLSCVEWNGVPVEIPSENGPENQ